MNKYIFAGIIVCILLIGLSFLYDDFAVKLAKSLKNPHLKSIMTFFSNSWIITGFFIAMSLVLIKKYEDFFLFWSSIALTSLVVFSIKFFIHRARPQGLIIKTFGFVDYSFPSMHTALMFSTVYLLSLTLKNGKYVFFGLAALVGLSRIYLMHHYLSDVVFGGSLGFFSGYAIYYLEQNYKILLNLIK